MSTFSGGRVSDAERRGVSRHRLRTGAFDRLAHDLYVPAGTTASLLDQCRALAHVLPPDHAYCFGTAARLEGLPLPTAFDDRIHVAVPAGHVVPNRPELVTHTLLLPPAHVTVIDGVRVTTPPRTFLDLAVRLRETALVALGDAALHLGVVTHEELMAVVDGAVRRRGVVMARCAVRRLDGRAESPPESMTRVWLEDARLPFATPQAVIVDRAGGFVARVDLLIESYRIVIEYEGAYHRDRDQYGRDLSRRNQLEALGYLVVHLDATMLRRDTVVAIVTAALRQRGWTPSR